MFREDVPRLTRRHFIAAGAAAGAALALPGRIERPTVARPRPHKLVSLSGPAPLLEARHPNDYRWHGNREYLRDVSGTRFVKLWVSWADLQRDHVPQSRAESWEQLAAFRVPPAGDAALRELDRQVSAVNEDGLRAILTIYQAYPAWATGSVGDEARFPEDLAPDSPWAWFVEHLLVRYRRDRPANPDGARIDALEVCNEPNFLLGPQERATEATAQKIVTAARLSAAHGHMPLLAPGTSDFPDAGRLPPSRATDWRAFTAEVLDRLRGARLEAPVGWSHHNYQDMKYGGDRAARVARMLDRVPLWITEGGYDMEDPADPAERLRQAEALVRGHAQCAAIPGCRTVAQHTINDLAADEFKSGLRDDFDVAAGRPGPPRPAAATWAALPGALRAG